MAASFMLPEALSNGFSYLVKVRVLRSGEYPSLCAVVVKAVSRSGIKGKKYHPLEVSKSYRRGQLSVLCTKSVV